MLVDVVRLRRSGLVLRPPELEAPVRGELSVVDGDAGGSLKRPHLVAHLEEHIGASGTPRSVMKPLFDVVLLRLDGASFTLQGFEIESFKDGELGQMRVRHLEQMWRVTPVAPQPPL